MVSPFALRMGGRKVPASLEIYQPNRRASALMSPSYGTGCAVLFWSDKCSQWINWIDSSTLAYPIAMVNETPSPEGGESQTTLPSSLAPLSTFLKIDYVRNSTLRERNPGSKSTLLEFEDVARDRKSHAHCLHSAPPARPRTTQAQTRRQANPGTASSRLRSFSLGTFTNSSEIGTHQE